MNAERIFYALGLIDQRMIAEAAPRAAVQRRKTSWRTVFAAAACLALICTIGGWFASGHLGHFSENGCTSGASSGADGGTGIVHEGETGSTVFMQYAGPVFPLTTEEPSGGLTAERAVTWDFSPGTYADGEPRQWGATVTDAYTLSNATDQDIAVTALYPFAGNFFELSSQLPTATLNGAEVETGLYAGAYSGGFQSTIGADIPGSMNLDSLNSWTEYKALLENGSYLAQALGDSPVLDVPVTVYDFTHFAAPHETYQAATQAISFIIDENATQILTYGFNGMDAQENGFRRYSYFVPDGMRREPDTKLLVVLGSDISSYSLQGYQNGACADGEEIDGVSCTIIRTETTLDAVLDRLCRAYADWYAKGLAVDQENTFNTVPFSMYRRAVSELLTQYGPLDASPMNRYEDGRLDDILSETLHHDRVLYLSIPITIPAKNTVHAAFQFWKAPSHDFQCGEENTNLQGYDLVTQLGSAIQFTSQTAFLENTETITIAAQNFNFDLEKGVTSVNLALDQEHYYLEIQEKEE